jgi:putative ABC transport system permease protein
MARRFWPNGNAVGQSVQTRSNGPAIEIVGVVRDIKYYTLAEEPLPYIYASAAQYYTPDATIHIRTAGDPKALIRAAQKEIERLDPNLATEFTTFAEFRQAPLFPGRAMATVCGLFGLLALLLAAVGIYGVTSYTVGQRTREVGIRIALGAKRGAILRLIIGQGMTITLIGVGVGLVASLALTRYLSSLLFGVSAYDPLTFLMIALLLTFVAMLACGIPARRAMKIDPMIALRHD